MHCKATAKLARPWLFAAALLVTGPALADAGPPPEMFGQLESRLLQARHVRIEAQVEASGALQASLRGYTELHEANRAQFHYAGTLGGQPAELSLSADGRTLEVASRGRLRRLAVGAESNRAFLLGMTRAGLLHNLLRGAELAGPDHGDGGMQAWLSAESFRPVTFAQLGELAGLASMGFEAVADGLPAASVQLWLDPDSGLPRRREHSLHLRQGEVQVVENYTRFVVE